MDSLHLILCFATDFDTDYISHFCKYYCRCDFDTWNIILHTNNTADTSNLDRAEEKWLKQFAIHNVTSKINIVRWVGEFNSHTKVSKLNKLTETKDIEEGDWIVHVDVDEFVDCPDQIRTKIAMCNYPVVYGNMIDRFSESKRCLPLLSTDDIFTKFPLADNFTSKVLKACVQKPCFMQIIEKGSLLSSCHDCAHLTRRDYTDHDKNVIIWHFKWIDTTSSKLQYRATSFKQQGLSHWRESAAALREIFDKP